MKIIIKSYQAIGWIVDFYAKESQKIKDYCNDKNNKEDIEYFIGGPGEEDLIREVLDDEDYDIYENHLDTSDDYAPNWTSLKFDEHFEIFLSKNGQLSKVNIKDVRLEKSKINVKDLANMNTNDNGIAYSFGYISDDIIEIEIEINAKEFDLSKLTLNIVENAFFEEIGAYITRIEYNNEWLDTEFDDIDGDYFNPAFFKL